jgi:hypothetical protein
VITGRNTPNQGGVTGNHEDFHPGNPFEVILAVPNRPTGARRIGCKRKRNRPRNRPRSRTPFFEPTLRPRYTKGTKTIRLLFTSEQMKMAGGALVGCANTTTATPTPRTASKDVAAQYAASCDVTRMDAPCREERGEGGACGPSGKYWVSVVGLDLTNTEKMTLWLPEFPPRKLSPSEPIPVCKSCRFLDETHYVCQRRVKDAVSGDFLKIGTLCADERRFGDCGPEGLFWACSVLRKPSPSDEAE